MTDSLTVFGTDFTGVTGIKATGTGNGTLTYIRPQGTKSISSNGSGIDVTEYAAVDVAVPAPTPSLQSKTKSYTPSETAQSESVTADVGYDGLSSVAVNVGAISSTYIGSGITQRSSTDLSSSGDTITVPAGYYASQASKAVTSGTTGTPTATKGSVSNHAVSVTPSVTNTTGYITGSTKTGTAVTVSASELVSGSQTITSNNTYDVTNLASVVVNVAGGVGTLLTTYSMGTISTSSTQAADTGKSVSVSSVNNYDLLIVETSVNSVTNNRHTATVGLIFLTASSDVATKNGATVATVKWNSKISSSGTTTTRAGTTAYGIYPNSCSVSTSNSVTTATIPMYQRYNSTSTGTINGNYTTRVYGVNLYDLIGG